MPNPAILRAIVRSLAAGEQSVDAAVDRLRRTLGQSGRWMRPIALRYVASTVDTPTPRFREIIAFLLADPDFLHVWTRYGHHWHVHEWLTETSRMHPAPAASNWPVPAILSAGDLAAWLEVDPADLDWFADLKAFTAKSPAPRLRHYHYRILAKRFGAVRLIEAPKEGLKRIQRRILTGILDRIPLHPAVHGFRKGHSIKTFAAPHAGQRVVLRMDLQDYFPSFHGVRVQNLFRTIGYPEPVADILGGVCTNVAPHDIWRAAPPDTDRALLAAARILYARPHVPQGAPTSAALANLCTYRADCRLTGLAQAAGARYTRYADDLAFSGGDDFARSAERFAVHAAAILLEEGLHVHHRKTRIMRQGVRQYLAGVVANRHVNIIRADFDRLKATLTNCARHGPASQNRDSHADFRAHLTGRIAFMAMINPPKAERLRRIFDRINWP